MLANTKCVHLSYRSQHKALFLQQQSAPPTQHFSSQYISHARHLVSYSARLGDMPHGHYTPERTNVGNIWRGEKNNKRTT